jgi:LPXTG-site transpeptidase (sortase) family protein
MKKRHNNPHLNNQTFRFILSFGLIFLGTFIVLYALHLVPGEIISGENKGSFLDDIKLQVLKDADSANQAGELPQISEVPAEQPINIKIPKVGVDILVQNPDTTNNAVLNEYLKKGVVRYPGSGLLGKGNMFLFGHSAEAFKNVTNTALKAFNGIDKLIEGDEIYVKSDGSTYVYVVTSVRLVNADEALVDFSSNKNMITLSTCDTFGAKQERFVVEADFSKRI